MSGARVPRRVRLEPGRRALQGALLRVETLHRLSVLDMAELLAQALAGLLDFAQRHPRAAATPSNTLRGTPGMCRSCGTVLPPGGGASTSTGAGTGG